MEYSLLRAECSVGALLRFIFMQAVSCTCPKNFSRLGSKINIQKAVAFLHARNNQFRKYNGKKIPIITVTKIYTIKLGIN